MIAPFLEPRPGERIIDACAGAGGKTLHLAALMGNKGKIVALDVHERKLGDLKIRARRAGADSIEVRLVDSKKVIKRLRGTADRLLLDVPCSGSGVWRRNPDGRWKLSAAELSRLRTLQAQLMDEYCEMVKPSGTFVYSTCSIFPSENQNQIESFLGRRGGQFERSDEFHLSPGASGFDGFYAARLVRLK